MSDDLYSNELLRLATEARGQGRLDAPDASVTLDNPLCGDRITLDIRVANDHLAALGHEVKACVLCQASASILGRHAVGESVGRLREMQRQVRAMLKPAASAAPDDTPAAAPVEPWPEIAAFAPALSLKSRHACIELPFRALVAALDAAAKKAG